MIKINNGVIVNDIYVPRMSANTSVIKKQEDKAVMVIENGDYVILPDDGYGSMKRVSLNVSVPSGSGDSCNLTTLEVTENGVYYPITPVLIFDGDDAFNFAYADTPNAIEVKFKVNDRGWIFGNTTAGLFAEDKNLVSVYWFGYEGLFYIRENEVNTILIKPYDADGPVIVNGQDYGINEREFDSTESTEILIGGNEGERGYFDFYYAKFWSDYNSYHNGEVALFYNIPNEDGNIKYSTLGGDFQISTNIGGGACEYTEIGDFQGFSMVIVNVNPSN